MDSPQHEPRLRALVPGQQLALRFISGKYQGGEFPLAEGVPVVVGRSSDLDMVLVEEMVSRRHARVELRQGVVRVEDLGSTNGTFVNGERIVHGVLAEGDRLLIGTSILKLVVVDEQQSGAFSQRAVGGAMGSGVAGPGTAPPGSGRASGMGREPVVRATGKNTAVRMTGNLDEIPLPDLMQLLGTSKKSGTLVLHSDPQHGEKVGRIHLRTGELVHADIGDLKLSPLKAAYRMLEWTRGTFALELEDEKITPAVHVTAQAFLMEGIRQLDETRNLLLRLPGLDVRLGLRTPLRSPLQDLDQSKLEVLQAVISAPDLRAALDRSPHTDLETLRDVLDLLQRGYLEII